MAGIGEARAARSAKRLDMPDGDLIVLISRRERSAFAELYDRYGSASYRLAYRITRDQQLAETVVQEVFLTLWCQAARFDATRARVATWLLTITHHKAVDAVRREELRHTEPDDRVGDLADDSVDLPREAWLSAQREVVQRALASLPRAQRELIELAYFGGESQSQLAQRLGQPLGTIKSRTQTALARLRASLEADGLTSEVAFASI
jgi:RNA polymerase sigma factor (sigma-70 family)